MNILFWGVHCNEEIIDKMIEIEQVVPFAQLKLEKFIIKGFNQKENINFSVASVIPIQRGIRLDIFKEYLHKENNVDYIRFYNKPIFKQLTLFLNAIKKNLTWLSGNANKKNVIFIYGTNPLISIPALLMKCFFNVKVIVYVSEIDELRLLTRKKITQKIKANLFVYISKKIHSKYDGYIYVCESMGDKINKKNKPFCVIEGMVECDYSINIKQNKGNSIIYAGSLDKKYGIDLLVNGFIETELTNYNLIIYGDGNFKDDLINLSDIHSNIMYKGIAKNSEITSQYKNALLLVNPRPSKDEFTKYSFPSKTLEYFSSGTVALLSDLPGIPNEYFDYCFKVKNDTIEDIKESILEIALMSEKELLQKGVEAQKFVFNNKNFIVQTDKILELIKNI